MMIKNFVSKISLSNGNPTQYKIMLSSGVSIINLLEFLITPYLGNTIILFSYF